jgi:hypothetical protein
MSIEQKIFSIIVSVSLLLLILELIRRRKLREEYSVLWFLISMVIIILACSDRVLNFTTRLLKAKAPTSIVYMLGIVFLLLLNLHFSVSLSTLKNKLKELAQRIALLDAHLKKSEDE